MSWIRESALLKVYSPHFKCKFLVDLNDSMLYRKIVQSPRTGLQFVGSIGRAPSNSYEIWADAEGLDSVPGEKVEHDVVEWIRLEPPAEVDSYAGNSDGFTTWQALR